MYLLIAWRNLWRNKRRTGVILFAVFVGVWSMIFLGAFMRGMMVEMVRSGISTLTGDIQIHTQGYRNDPVINNSIDNYSEIDKVLKKELPSDAKWSKRVRVNAIVNNAKHSTGVTFVGIDPEKEKNISFIKNAIDEGRYLNADDKNGIIVGRALLDKFETKVGRKVVVMSQNKTGEIASKSFRIVGVFNADMESTEKGFVFVNISSAQKMLKMNESISEVCILLSDHKKSILTSAELSALLKPAGFEVHSWKELLPMLEVYIDIFDGYIFIWYVVIFVAMSFGIVNTTLMAVFERIREFGLLKSIGQKPIRIIFEVLTESFFILIIGMATGTLFSYLCTMAVSDGFDLSSFAAGAEFFGMSRIIYPVLTFEDVFISNLIVLVFGISVSLYPALKAARITPIEAMAHV